MLIRTICLFVLLFGENLNYNCTVLDLYSVLTMMCYQITDRPDNRNRDYAVLVFVHGNDFKWGDAVLYPGHILARKEVLVVTFNYRLGALGRKAIYLFIKICKCFVFFI